MLHCIHKIINNVTKIGKKIPEHVENLPSRIDPDQHVWHRDVLELRVLGVGEVDLGLPDGLDQVGVVEVEGLDQLLVLETGVEPTLSQVEVDLVVLRV